MQCDAAEKCNEGTACAGDPKSTLPFPIEQKQWQLSIPLVCNGRKEIQYYKVSFRNNKY